MPDRERAKRLLSRTEAAAHINVSVRSFDRLRQEISIPYVLLGKRRRYLPADLDDLIYDHRVVDETDDQGRSRING
jgi:hypothetical protein